MTSRLAVITGASGGIGRCIALRLAEQGFAVIVYYVKNLLSAQRVVDEIRHENGQAWLAKADLGTEVGVEALRQIVGDVLSGVPELRLTAIVNNASLMLGPQFGDVDAAAFDDYFQVNVRAPLLITQTLIPMMSPGGSVVNISSAAAHFASPGDIVYAMSKSALEALSRHSAPALAKVGVRINTVIPGFTDNGHPAFEDPTVRAHMSSFAALGGVADPIHVADAVAFLVSENAARITGVSLDVSGGSTIGARESSGQMMSLRDVSARFAAGVKRTTPGSDADNEHSS